MLHHSPSEHRPDLVAIVELYARGSTVNAKNGPAHGNGAFFHRLLCARVHNRHDFEH